MWQFLSSVFLLVFAAHTLNAQVLPKEGSKLNYRLIGFTAPKVRQVNKSRLEIAVGNFNSVDSFEKNLIKTYKTTSNKIVAEVPWFGQQYTWRMISEGKNLAKTTTNQLYHFSTLLVPEVDTAITRVRILKDTKADKDTYVFMDGTRALYNKEGHPIWFLPDIDGHKIEKSKLRDIKLSPKGTITFLLEEIGAYEVDYNATILWKAPNNALVNKQGQEFYHHEFTRLANGHYMVLGNEFNTWNQQPPSANDSSNMLHRTIKKNRERDSADINLVSLPFGTIIEYDEHGNVVWSWLSSQYFKFSDIYNHTSKSGKPDISVHENSFYFDEKDSIIYLAFRNISRVLKIKYPEGRVIETYGEIYKTGKPEAGNGLFCRQHSVRRSENGYLYLFDNNCCNIGDGLPKILKLRENNGGLEKIWEYVCGIDGIDTNNDKNKYTFPTGGNVVELQDGRLLINMSTVYSKVFILDGNKQVLWSAIPEKWNKIDKKWNMIYNYRASIITDREELENLIWNMEKK